MLRMLLAALLVLAACSSEPPSEHQISAGAGQGGEGNLAGQGGSPGGAAGSSQGGSSGSSSSLIDCRDLLVEPGCCEAAGECVDRQSNGCELLFQCTSVGDGSCNFYHLAYLPASTEGQPCAVEGQVCVHQYRPSLGLNLSWVTTFCEGGVYRSLFKQHGGACDPGLECEAESDCFVDTGCSLHYCACFQGRLSCADLESKTPGCPG